LPLQLHTSVPALLSSLPAPKCIVELSLGSLRQRQQIQPANSLLQRTLALRLSAPKGENVRKDEYMLVGERPRLL
jgi:hypothetical protein